MFLRLCYTNLEQLFVYLRFFCLCLLYFKLKRNIRLAESTRNAYIVLELDVHNDYGVFILCLIVNIS